VWIYAAFNRQGQAFNRDDLVCIQLYVSAESVDFSDPH